MNANHPSPVRKDWGLAVWASLISPNPSSYGSRSTIRSYLTRNFFLRPEKYRCLVVNPRSVVDAPCDPDAESVGAAPSFPSGDDLQVVHALHDPDQFLGFHQVERDSALDVLLLGDYALGDVPDDRGLDQGGLDSVPVQLLSGVRPKCSMYLARAFSSSKVRSPSSRVPLTATFHAWSGMACS